MSEAIPEQFWQGVEQFNQRDFYACHDTLEAIWMEAPEVDKKFYQGILQIAVSFYHLSNHNWRGAAILLGEGVNRLSGYQPSYYEVNVEQLRLESIAILQYLQTRGPEKVAEVADRLFSDRPSPSEPLGPGRSPVPPLPKIVKTS
jgi:predicted metal-dependent hydrolase